MSRLLTGIALFFSCVIVQPAEFQFATAAEGATIPTADDDFMRAMSPADPALRMLSTKPQALAALKQSYAAHALE